MALICPSINASNGRNRSSKFTGCSSTFNAWVTARTPAQRWGRFEELWGTLIYLASDASAFVSGQNIFVDGGMTSVV